MVIIRGLALSTYNKISRLFYLDDSKAHLFDNSKSYVDVELPDDLAITHNGNSTSLYIGNYCGLLPNTVYFMSKNDYEYIEIK